MTKNSYNHWTLFRFKLDAAKRDLLFGMIAIQIISLADIDHFELKKHSFTTDSRKK